MLVLIYDDLEADPQAFLDTVCDFIGIARFPISASRVGAERVNTVNTQPPNPRLARRSRVTSSDGSSNAAELSGGRGAARQPDHQIPSRRRRSVSSAYEEVAQRMREFYRSRSRKVGAAYRPRFVSVEVRSGAKSIGGGNFEGAAMSREGECGEPVQLSDRLLNRPLPLPHSPRSDVLDVAFAPAAISARFGRARNARASDKPCSAKRRADRPRDDNFHE